MPSMMYVSAHHYVDPGVIHQISSLQVTEITSLSFIRPKKIRTMIRMHVSLSGNRRSKIRFGGDEKSKVGLAAGLAMQRQESHHLTL